MYRTMGTLFLRRIRRGLSVNSTAAIKGWRMGPSGILDRAYLCRSAAPIRAGRVGQIDPVW